MRFDEPTEKLAQGSSGPAFEAWNEYRIRKMRRRAGFGNTRDRAAHFRRRMPKVRRLPR